MVNLKPGAKIAVEKCLKVKKGESVLIVTDEPCRRIGMALWEAAKNVGAEAMCIEIIPRFNNGEEPPAEVAEMLKHVDVFFGPTSRSFTHTDARRNACKAGARGATLPGIREESFARTLTADYVKIAKRAEKLAKMITKAKTARLTTPLGTDLTMSLAGREGHADHGLVHKKGSFSNLPAGEAYVAPLEGTANGVFIIDGSIGNCGVLKKPMKVVVKDGYAVSITGGSQTKEFLKLIAPHGKPALNVAELGIGLNDKAIICGSVLEDEKILGTVHIALGDNASMGGKIHVPSHQDGIITKPTLYLDKNLVLKAGKLMI